MLSCLHFVIFVQQEAVGRQIFSVLTLKTFRRKAKVPDHRPIADLKTEVPDWAKLFGDNSEIEVSEEMTYTWVSSSQLNKPGLEDHVADITRHPFFNRSDNLQVLSKWTVYVSSQILSSPTAHSTPLSLRAGSESFLAVWKT